MKCKAASPFYW